MCPGAPAARISDAIVKLSGLLDRAYADADALDSAIAGIKNCSDVTVMSKYCRDSVIPAMNKLRITADMLEQNVGAKYWPFPTYSDLLFNV